MKSNYEPLGKHIQLVDYRNSEEVTSTVLGISIDKEFMPSVANVIGTDLSRYKLISKGLFACILSAHKPFLSGSISVKQAAKTAC